MDEIKFEKNRINILVSSHYKTSMLLIQAEIIKNIKKQVLVIDVNRLWQPDKSLKRIRFLRPNSKEELLEILSDIQSLISPRMKFLVLDGVLNFLRDFYGRQYETLAMNRRMYSYILNQLQNLINGDRIIVITNNLSGFTNNSSIMEEVSDYYNCNLIRIQN